MQPSPTASRRAQIRTIILDDLHAGVLVPGDTVRIDSLSRQLRLSPIPVREELWRLAGEGLLVARPRYGFCVPRLRSCDLDQLYQARRLLLLATLTPQWRWRSDIAIDPLDEGKWFHSIGDQIIRGGSDLAIADLWHRTTLRLAPFIRAESRIPATDGVIMLQALRASDLALARKTILRLCRHQQREASATVHRATRAEGLQI